MAAPARIDREGTRDALAAPGLPERARRMRENAGVAAELMRALSHEGRLAILCLLVEGERSVGEIERLLDLRQPAVSQQLARLRAEGLVRVRRSGKLSLYALAREDVAEVIATLHRIYCEAPERAPAGAPRE